MTTIYVTSHETGTLVARVHGANFDSCLSAMDDIFGTNDYSCSETGAQGDDLRNAVDINADAYDRDAVAAELAG